MILDLKSMLKLPLTRSIGFGLFLTCIQFALHGFFSPLYLDFFLVFFTLMLIRARISHLVVLAVFFGLLQEYLTPLPAGFFLCRNLGLIAVAFIRHLFVWRKPVTWAGLFVFSAFLEAAMSTFLRSQISGFGSIDSLLSMEFYMSSPWAIHFKTLLLFVISFLFIAFFFYGQKAHIYGWIYRFHRRTKKFQFAKGVS